MSFGACVTVSRVILVAARPTLVSVRVARVLELICQFERRLRALLHLLWVALCHGYFARGDCARFCTCFGSRCAAAILHVAIRRAIAAAGALLEVVVAKVLHAFALAALAKGQVTPRIRAHLLLLSEAVQASAKAKVLNNRCGCGAHGDEGNVRRNAAAFADYLNGRSSRSLVERASS